MAMRVMGIGTEVPLCYGLWKSPAKMEFYLFLFKKKTKMFADSKISPYLCSDNTLY